MCVQYVYFICVHAGCYGASEFVYIMGVILTAKFVFALPYEKTTLGKSELVKSVHYVKMSFFFSVHLFLFYFRCSNYAGEESEPSVPAFKARQPPSVQLGAPSREYRTQYVTPLSSFKLYFTVDLIQHLCNYMKEYARIHDPHKWKIP